MPEIGEIRRADEIGHKGSYKFIWQACQSCGKERWVRLVKNKPRDTLCLSCGCRNRHTSAETRAKMSATRKGCHCGKAHPNWKGGKVKQACLECGKPFYVEPYRIRKGKGKFCSNACGMIYLRKQGYFAKLPNKPEQILINFFAKCHLSFKYTGDGEVWLGNRNPDFINTNGKKQVIELLGTYWHPIFDGADRIEHYKQYGFKTLIIWEDELKDMGKVLTKVKKFIKV